jgi:UDP-glucuronate 4-epimerase
VGRKNVKTLVTGAAGFIGYHVARRLLEAGGEVVGADNLNAYYDPALKRARLAQLAAWPGFEFIRIDAADRVAMEALFASERFGAAIHLAAQAGVRYSVENPHVYAESNLVGFLNVLEGVRRTGVRHLVYASSSSVYGGNSKIPFSVADRTDAPVSLYAATKKANELMAHCYSHLYGIAATGLRFFTVYGPWGRPDMAPLRFARAIARGRRLEVYNYGRMWRDFTYIDDVVEGVTRVARSEGRGHRVFNVGYGQPIGLLDFIHEMEHALGQRARKRFLPLQAGDVPATHADAEDFWRMVGYRPRTGIETGVAKLVEWYREYYGESGQGTGDTGQCRVAVTS